MWKKQLIVSAHIFRQKKYEDYLQLKINFYVQYLSVYVFGK